MAERHNKILRNGIKVLGEAAVLPGTSLLLDGKIKAGALHAGGGILAKLVLGVPGLVLVAANSYSQSVTGQSLLQNVLHNKAPDSSLKEIVEQDLASGKTPEEIKAGLAEDVDDICAQA